MEKRQWLKDKRINAKLTQRQISEFCGISESYYSLIENGIRNVPVKTAKKIAKILNFDWTEFYK